MELERTTPEQPDHAHEIVSLNADDLTVEELEERLEMMMVAHDCCPADGCNGFSCGTYG
ncbi:MAG: hypothetical protein ACRDJE_02720 [Dehalococcoidia bacterium]